MSSEGTVLYIGGFELPDKNAAAQRVISIGKILRDLNYNVVFVGTDKDTKESNILKNDNTYFGFNCFAEKYPRGIRAWLTHLTSSKQYISLIERIGNVKIVVFYNFQSVAMKRILRYCKKHNIKCLSDVTEWYQPGGSIVHRLLKQFDTDYRMKVLNKKCDGVIAISAYLYRYYADVVNTVKIPPLVDIRDGKWTNLTKSNKDTSFVYAGKASDRKERLDLVMDAIDTLNQQLGNVTMKVVGLTHDQYCHMYGRNHCPSSVDFLGRLSHIDTIKVVSAAQWSIIARERSRVNEAGFPTKLVESISCGTPICANRFSNIDDYLDESNSKMCNDINDIEEAMSEAISVSCNNFNRFIFDYRNYIGVLKEIVIN